MDLSKNYKLANRLKADIKICVEDYTPTMDQQMRDEMINELQLIGIHYANDVLKYLMTDLGIEV